MKQNSSFVNTRTLAAAAVFTAAWMFIQPGLTQSRDPFESSNQKLSDPFSEINKAPPIDWTKLQGPGGAVKNNIIEQKAAPANPKGVQDLIDFDVAVSPKEARRGQMVQVTVTGTTRKGYYTYSMTRVTEFQSGPAISTFKVAVTPGLRPLPPIMESEPVLETEESLKESFLRHRKTFTWTFDLLVLPEAKTGQIEFPFAVAMQVCNLGCTPGEIPLKAVFSISPAEQLPIPPEIKSLSEKSFPPEPLVIKTGSAPKPAKADDVPLATSVISLPHDYEASITAIKKQISAQAAVPNEGLIAFMLTGMFWGFVSLITPCVFPMIPITVSFFLKQSEKEHHKPVTMALVYCGTIVLVLTIAAAALLNFFRVLSISPLMNFGLGFLFVFFALSLFGMYEIELPSFLARYTSQRESKGGMVGTVFMALTFTIISFACVAPFLGGFGGTAGTNTRPFWHTILGGLSFSVTFASPFFILALFPTLLRSVPKSGAWLNSVKVVMGFLELAAALKFFRAGELVMASPLGLFTFDLVLSLCIAICILCGLYLLGVYRLPLDSPIENLSVPRMFFAFAFVGLGFYMLPALFVKSVEGEQLRPTGQVYALINSFFLAEPSASASGEVWGPNLEHAVAQAREFRKRTGKAKLVFIDFTGEVCNNCRLNENNVFSRGEIQQLFKSYVLVKLYCDRIPLKYYSSENRAAAETGRRKTDAKINYDFQAEVFDRVELPLYVILEPLLDGRISVIAKYTDGLIRSESEFAEFLRKPLKDAGTTLASR